MIRERFKMGHPIVMTPAQTVTEEEFGTIALQELVTDLFDTQHYYNGVGLAAPQIGVSKRVAVLGFTTNSRYKNKPSIADTVIINPEIEDLSGDLVEDWEGCISAPGLRAPVPRPTKIRCRYRDVQGVQHEIIAENFHARVLQHEFDHLCGIVFPARVKNFKKFGFEDSLPEYSQSN